MNLYKTFAVITNLFNYAVGIAVAIILLFKKDFISVFYISGMSSNESLFFNLILFQLGLVLIGIVVCLMADDKKKADKPIEFPVFYELLPAAFTVLSIFYAFQGDTVREKILVIVLALLYAALSAVIIYCGSRVFQLFDEK